MERIYAIVHLDRREAYIGRTDRTLKERFKEHLKIAASGDIRMLYAELRHAPQLWEILECEVGPYASEARWVQLFKDEGYNVLNLNRGTRSAPKVRIKDRHSAFEKPLRIASPAQQKPRPGLMKMVRDESPEWARLVAESQASKERWARSFEAFRASRAQTS